MEHAGHAKHTKHTKHAKITPEIAAELRAAIGARNVVYEDTDVLENYSCGTAGRSRKSETSGWGIRGTSPTGTCTLCRSSPTK
jgi:hypothetical protein